MTELSRTWNLTETQWAALLTRALSHPDSLEDGAYVRIDTLSGDLFFYATPFNKPQNWRYPFAEEIAGTEQPGAFIGHVWHEPATGFVHFEIVVYAAAQALRADYESDVSDLDYVTYEQAVESAVRGTDEDLTWLESEFARLESLSRPV